MELMSVAIKDFRSITTAKKIPLSRLSVLLGPNNEGKSNVLAAIVLALAILSKGRYSYRRQFLRYRYDNLEAFHWNRDYPVDLQKSKPTGKSQVTLEFCLDVSDKRRFKKQTGINLNANLRLKVEFGPEEAKLDLLLSGPVKKRLNQKIINSIAAFVADSIYIEYIPAVRTSDLTLQAVNRLLSDRLSLLESDPQYRSHLQAIEKLQKPVLAALSKELTESVRGFLPEVTSVAIQTERSLARAISRSTSVDIDDGTKTSLSLKGDGIKSLTAISLMRHLGRLGLRNRTMILAVEEPESHLHPSAVHRLREVLKEVSQDCQVLLTTHNAALVNRLDPSQNIIVQGGAATPATGIDQVIKSLGILQSDNLSSASLVLLCEGPGDVKILTAWLSQADSDIRRIIESGVLAFDSMDGVANLAYKARSHKCNVAEIHAFVDNDEAGRSAIKVAKDSSAIVDSEYTACVCPSIGDTEIEDLVEESSYLPMLNEELGTSLSIKDLHARPKLPWSSRMMLLMQESGKIWNKALEKKLKWIVCEAASSTGIASLKDKRRHAFDVMTQRFLHRSAR